MVKKIGNCIDTMVPARPSHDELIDILIAIKASQVIYKGFLAACGIFIYEETELDEHIKEWTITCRDKLN